MKPNKLIRFAILPALTILFTLNSIAQVEPTDDVKNAGKDSLLGRSLLQQYLPQYQTAAERAQDSITQRRLIDLALAQPQVSQAESQNKILDYQLKKQRNNWLNLLSLSTNLNDQTFAAHPNNSAYVYPKYFVGVSIPLGLIVSSGTDIKITKESQIIAKDQEAELRKSIKAQIVSNYTQYKAYGKLLAIQNQIVDDEQANLMQVQQKFKDGTATFEVYNDASKKYNDEVVKTINLQLTQDLVKVDIEKMIGRKMEDIFK